MLQLVANHTESREYPTLEQVRRIFGPLWRVVHRRVDNGVYDELQFWHVAASPLYGPQVFRTVPIMWQYDEHRISVRMAVRPVRGRLFDALRFPLEPCDGVGIGFRMPDRNDSRYYFKIRMIPMRRMREWFDGHEYHWGCSILFLTPDRVYGSG